MAKTPDLITRYIRHPLEAVSAVLVYGLFRLLPVDWASNLGGWLGRVLGPRLGVTRRACRNLTRAYPNKTRDEIAHIIADMWDNLGRMAGEYPHLKRFRDEGFGPRFEIVGVEHVDALRDDGKPGIFLCAHLANWEFTGLAATLRGLPVDRVYRQSNNRMTEWLFTRGRSGVDGGLIPKGPAGAKLLLKSLNDGKHLGMLVDQKMNDGIPVPFFGHDAMTAPAIAQLALRMDCPVVPIRVKRLAGARFQVIAEPPIDFTPSGDRHADVAAFMAKVNAIIEAWVRDTPEQWLWLHNRWPD